MNKFGVVLGVAAVATLAGCKDPDYRRSGSLATQNEVKNVETATEARPAPISKRPAAQPVTVKPIAIEPVAAPKCTCAPGTKHAKPCACGAADCQCIVETRPVVVADVSQKPADPEYTIYVVQNGDYLAKISKKFNVKIDAIKSLNPTVKNDVIRVGQKLKLPGKIDVGDQSAALAAAAKPAAKKAYAPYAGATKEYVVKSGDTLGAIAYGNGINIRQLKELNGLTSDSLKIGQKLKIPAAKGEAVAAKAEKAKTAAPAAAKKAEAPKPVVAASVAAPVEKAEPAVAEAAPVEDAPAEAEKPAAEAPAAKADAAQTTTYMVQEGDDMTGVSIRWGVSAAEIRELNNLADGEQLVPGQVIKLPADAQQ